MAAGGPAPTANAIKIKTMVSMFFDPCSQIGLDAHGL
jgi:hypothetical protein